MKPELEQLLSLPHVWQASRLGRAAPVIATGYGSLDQRLHHGGWPAQATTELLLPRLGLGELRLLLPALRQAQHRRWLVFVNPPHQPHAAALAQQGLNPHRVLVIHPASDKELLWSAEQVLHSGCCGAVITWGGPRNLTPHQLRRLQQAAQRGDCWHTLLRNAEMTRQASPSALRIALQATARGLLQLQIVKQRGGWAGQQLELRVKPDLTQRQPLSPEQLPLPKAQDKQRPIVFPSEPCPATDSHKVVPLTTVG